ncbi:MAG: hypothetical protein ACPGSB_01045 [Opitutales bacterium]
MMLFKLFTGVAGVYHVMLGLSGLVLPHELFARVAAIVLGIQSEMDTTFRLVAKFASVYVLVFGICILIFMMNPQKYRVIAIPVLALFGIRLINKIVYFGSITESFSISTGQGIFAISSLAVLFFGILFTLPKKEEV